VTQAKDLALEMEQAYARGDQHTARLLARQLVRASSATEAELQAAARAVLQRTEPDAFLMVTGVLGLGVVVWLIYAYVL
jgi:hypothetical protein